jgi:hypothetical protein
MSAKLCCTNSSCETSTQLSETAALPSCRTTSCQLRNHLLHCDLPPLILPSIPTRAFYKLYQKIFRSRCLAAFLVERVAKCLACLFSICSQLCYVTEGPNLFLIPASFPFNQINNINVASFVLPIICVSINLPNLVARCDWTNGMLA